ncbi:hypothetical protein V7x_06290 [Crateriforma conspicua]|uniref:Prenyltransferase and squalene oxidase repeat protein n=1 Tax=Crateriforma conspicua TaxID=2527996 RepID=A0A5C6FS79_9PLAN|nr:hypothetical protein [Crateriforma spongiae]TWU65084.1 hypothetical protein V7x_06290 [Crateriforma conspicua]
MLARFLSTASCRLRLSVQRIGRSPTAWGATAAWGFLLWVATGLFGTLPSASAYSPYDPQVMQMVDRGVQYLESLNERSFAQVTTGFGQGVGQRAMVAYAHHKVVGDPNAPAVTRGVERVRWLLDRMRRTDTTEASHSNKLCYTVAVSILLLADLDPDGYKSELNELYRLMQQFRLSNGGYTYPGEKNGDTSQTQYAVLALWTLLRNGFDVDQNQLADTIRWLGRVQDVQGGWPYHGVDTAGGQRINQRPVSMSTTLAAGSALLIAADALQTFGDTGGDDVSDIEGLPKALKIYREESERRKKVRVPRDIVMTPISYAERYRAENPYERVQRVSGFDWYYYQLYTLERYESFLEFANGTKAKSPAWYNDGVEELKEYQDPKTGGFGIIDGAGTNPGVSTAFAVLFLIRSTQKSIVDLNRGSLAGSRGLPSDTTDIRVEGTKIKGRPIAAAVTDLLDILEDDGADELDGQSLPEDLELSDDPDVRKAQLDRLERLVRGSRSWQARRVAARLLGSSDELRVVPSLIFALSDNDAMVQRFARDGLRFISRKFDGVGMPDEPDREQVVQAQRDWRRWYHTMEPNYVFLESDLR